MSLSAVAGLRGLESHNPETSHTSLPAFDSLTNSQNSSFDVSAASQSSLMRPSLAADPGPAQADAHHGPVTPSTSLSNRSSQEQALDSSQADKNGKVLTDKKANFQGEPSPPFVPAARSMQLPASSRNYTSAPKRMANGAIKTTSESLPTSPAESNLYAHSRNSSTTSRSSQIAELSSQLKTRLSYMKVKLDNGWQRHNISELEHMTSQPNSPVSATFDTRQAYTPPMTIKSPLRDPVSTQSHRQHRTIVPQQYSISSPTSPQKRMATEATSYLISPTAPIQANTYESFWREHSGCAIQRPHQVPVAQMGGPSLAPPVEFQSRNPKHGEPAKGQHPPLLQTSASYHPFKPPSTPTSKPPPTKMRTPSQQAAVEKDAVETLLTMSSPGNSGYQPAALFPGTPLRDRVTYDEKTPSQRTDHGSRPQYMTSRPMAAPTSPRRRPLSESDIDKMIDEMSESSSSEDESSVVQQPVTQFRGSL